MSELNRSSVIGAVVGNIIGSRFSFSPTKSKNFKLFVRPNSNVEMSDYEKKLHSCDFTGDTVMTLAIASALMEADGDYNKLSRLAIENMREFGNKKYPFEGYGMGFCEWLSMPTPIPYNSFGNGSAMRISAVPYFAKSLDEVKMLSRMVTTITHNHPEGIKGAEATACAIWLALNGYDKEYIKEFIDKSYYSMRMSYKTILEVYGYDNSCQGSVPLSLFAFFISDSYEDTIRTVISMGGDADTMACIAGAVAGAYYGVPEEIEKEGLSYLTDDLKEILLAVEEKRNNM